jgi:cell division protease FtsH
MRTNKEKDPNNNDEKKGLKGAIFFIIAFLLMCALLMIPADSDGTVKQKSFSELRDLISSKALIVSETYPLELVVREGGSTQSLRGFYKEKEKIVQNQGALDPKEETQENSPKEDLLGGNTPIPFVSTIYIPFNGEQLNKLLNEEGLSPTIKVESNAFGSFLINFLPLILFLLILYFIFFSQMRGASKGPFGFGKSKAKISVKQDNKITFKDVAGIEEAKEEVEELVEFLRDPKKFQRLGGRIPKGVLMAGSPGTGKTLLAKAIAGEANVPFFSISGSDFVEMFVGVGASRVRDMFEQAKKSAPCLLFIDEIDAVGRHRGGGMGGGHDEREQTLNALLVEMDGFDTQSGIIIIAATNRPDVLDPALLRPGRFDRQVNVSLPDIKGRLEILKVHCKKVKLSADVDLERVSKGTGGYSGAELANLVNEAALLAAKRDLKCITLSELEEARDKVRWGKERKSLIISEKERRVTAYHEAGHALLLVLLEHTEPLHKVTIIPRGPSLGSTMWLPEGDKYNTRQKELLDIIVVALGGRVAEEIIFGDITSGASGDIKMVSQIARNMVCKWGMSEKIGMILYGGEDSQMFLARDINKIRDYSEKTAQEIDDEVKRIIKDCYNLAKALLLEKKRELETIASALLEFETLNGEEIDILIKDKNITGLREMKKIGTIK